jgi:allophanate hydrolase
MAESSPSIPLDIVQLSAMYRSGAVTPGAVAAEVVRRLEMSTHPHVWITVATADQIRKRGQELERLGPSAARPLFGIPFAVKDNIDVAGVPTTCACPEFAYTPTNDATVVKKLLEAGAIFVGKTNLDQFATGLNGTRSPYDAPRCVFDRDYIAGGSSSGSAVAVAGGLVSFSLGTDTAGSGRVPASFNNLIGLKPTKGRLSTTGLVPACRSIDCITVFTTTIADAAAVLAVVEGYDEADAFSRRRPVEGPSCGSAFRFGVPRDGQLKFFGDDAARKLYFTALERLEAAGGTRTEFDYAPFDAAATLLYGGAFVAERYAAVGKFLDERPGVGHPVVRKIVEGARIFSAADAFAGIYEMAALRRRSEKAWADVDVLALPTAGTIYRVDEMLADPIALNSNLGYYTNFVNLFDLCAIAIPAGFRPNGLPFGITLIGPAWHDRAICDLAQRCLSVDPITVTQQLS